MKKQKTIQIPSEFERLLDNDWREAAVYGGRFSLKSHTVARVLLIRARQEKIRVGCFGAFERCGYARCVSLECFNGEFNI